MPVKHARWLEERGHTASSPVVEGVCPPGDWSTTGQNLMHSSLTITDSIYGILTGGDVAERIAGLNCSEMGNEDVIGRLEKLLKQLKSEG